MVNINKILSINYSLKYLNPKINYKNSKQKESIMNTEVNSVNSVNLDGNKPVHEEVYDQSATTATQNRIVCIALDSSSHSEYCFNYCMKNVIKTTDQVILLNVRPQFNYPTFDLSPYGGIYEWFDQVDNDVSFI